MATRELQQRFDDDAHRPRNQDFDSVSAAEIASIFRFLLEQSTGMGEEILQQQLPTNPKLPFDIRVAKVCLKCSDVGFQDLPTQILLNSGANGFQSYCNIDSFGWDATQSALVL